MIESIEARHIYLKVQVSHHIVPYLFGASAWRTMDIIFSFFHSRISALFVYLCIKYLSCILED